MRQIIVSLLISLSMLLMILSILLFLCRAIGKEKWVQVVYEWIWPNKKYSSRVFFGEKFEDITICGTLVFIGSLVHVISRIIEPNYYVSIWRVFLIWMMFIMYCCNIYINVKKRK